MFQAKSQDLLQLDCTGEQSVLVWILLLTCDLLSSNNRYQWLSWMRRPTGDQEVAGSTPAEVGNILSWRLIMKFSTVVLSLPLIQEGQLSVSGERMHNTGQPLIEDLE